MYAFSGSSLLAVVLCISGRILSLIPVPQHPIPEPAGGCSHGEMAAVLNTSCAFELFGESFRHTNVRPHPGTESLEIESVLTR